MAGGAQPGVAHAPAGTGSVGKTWDPKAGKWFWRGRVTVDGRRHYGRGFLQQPGQTDATCRRLARQHLDQVIADLKANKVVVREKQRERLGAHLDRWLVAQRDALPRDTPTYPHYESIVRLHVRPFLGHERIAAVTAAVVLDWRAVLADVALQRQRRVALEHRGPRTPTIVKVASTILRRVLLDARANSYPVADDVLALKHPRSPAKAERPVLTEAQIDLLCRTAPAPRGVLWRVGFYGGLRDGELRGLKWSHVLWASASLDVRNQLDRRGKDRAPKKGSSGEVFLPDFVVAELREHQRWMREAGYATDLGDYVFQRRDRRGGAVPYANQRTWADLKADAAAAGLDPRVATHALRHGLGMATAAVSTALATRDQLRHRLLTTTDLYTGHRDAEGQKRAAAGIGERRIARKIARNADDPGANSVRRDGVSDE